MSSLAVKGLFLMQKYVESKAEFNTRIPGSRCNVKFNENQRKKHCQLLSMETLLQMLLQKIFLSKLLELPDRQASYAKTVLTSCLTTRKAFEAVQRFQLKLSAISVADENLWI